MSTTGPDPATPEPRDEELAGLHRRIAQLEAEAAARARRPEHHRVRTFFATLLIILAGVPLFYLWRWVTRAARGPF